MQIRSIKELNDVASKGTYTAALNRPVSTVPINQRLLGHAGMTPQRQTTVRGPPPLRPSAPAQQSLTNQAPPGTPDSSQRPPAPAQPGLNAGATAFAPNATSTPA